MRRVRPLALVTALLICPATALAQAGPEPVPPFAIDVRGFYAGLGQDPLTAAELGIAATSMPGRGLGGAATVNLYPLRGRAFALGLMGEAIIARGRATREDAEGMPLGPTVEQRLRGLSAGISLNFGHRDGWSYLSGAMGPMSFGTFQGEAAPAESAPVKNTINVGGGARWFVNRHLGVTFDVRFYLTRPELATAAYPGRQRTRLVVLSGGISIK